MDLEIQLPTYLVTLHIGNNGRRLTPEVIAWLDSQEIEYEYFFRMMSHPDLVLYKFDMPYLEFKTEEDMILFQLTWIA